MIIENKNKVIFRKMLPIEQNTILMDRTDVQQCFDNDNWVSVGPNDLFDPLMIYRTKPKALSPNELYEKVSALDGVQSLPCKVMISQSAVLSLIKQLEGFKGE